VSIISPVHIIFFAAVALLALGPRRFPEFTRALGAGVRELRALMGAAATARERAGEQQGADPNAAAPPAEGA
jgi:Sec-independent protein translocase protein TatA